MLTIMNQNNMQRNRTNKSSWIPQDREDRVTLDESDARELRIIKQAIIKSAIESNQIQKLNGMETDEEFVERWIKYIYKNTVEDKELTESPPF